MCVCVRVYHTYNPSIRLPSMTHSRGHHKHILIFFKQLTFILTSYPHLPLPPSSHLPLSPSSSGITPSSGSGFAEVESDDCVTMVQLAIQKCLEKEALCNEFYLQLIKQTTDQPGTHYTLHTVGHAHIQGYMYVYLCVVYLCVYTYAHHPSSV